MALADIPAIVTRACEQPVLIGWYAGLGVLCTLVPYLLYPAGLKHLEPSKAAIFATIEQLGGLPVTALFNPKDLPGYASHDAQSCPWCRAGKRLDALVNSFGYSKL